jgi:hypothetical protein
MSLAFNRLMMTTTNDSSYQEENIEEAIKIYNKIKICYYLLIFIVFGIYYYSLLFTIVNKFDL